MCITSNPIVILNLIGYVKIIRDPLKSTHVPRSLTSTFSELRSVTPRQVVSRAIR